MKRIFLMLMALALIASACGDDDSTDTTAGSTATTGGATATTAGSAATADEPIEIEMWVAFTDDGRLGFTEDRADEFNAAHPEYNVVVTGFDSYNTVFEQAALAIDDGNPPELIHFFEAATQEARDAVDSNGDPIFTSVTDAIAGRTEILGEPIVLDDVVSAATKYYAVDGELFSSPWNTSTTIMFNNMDMLRAAGINEPPTTWAAVEEACTALAALADGPENCITWPNHSWFFEQSIAQSGVNLVNNDNGRSARATEIDLLSDGALSYVQWWADLNEAGSYVYTGTQRDWSGTSAAFQAENVAMLVYSSSDTVILTDAGVENGFDVQTSFMPYNQEVDYAGNIIGGATLYMVAGLETVAQDGALAFMNFFSNPQNAATWHEITGYIPITNEAVALLNSEGWYEANPNASTASDQLDAAADTPAAIGPLVGNFVAIRDVVTAAVEDILVNGVDVVERMTVAQADAQRLLDDYNELFGG